MIHSQIITATIERPSCISPGARSMFDALRINRHSRPVLRSCLDMSPWTTVHGQRQKWQRQVHHQASSGQHHTVQLGGVIWYSSGGRRGDRRNRTPKKELAAIRCSLSNDESATMRPQPLKRESAAKVEWAGRDNQMACGVD
jgi:hypothetical protein